MYGLDQATCDRLITLLIENTDGNGRPYPVVYKNKAKNIIYTESERLIKIFDGLCYNKLHIYWKVYNVNNIQHIIVCGGFALQTLLKRNIYPTIHYIPDYTSDLTENWDELVENKKFQKCFVITLEAKIFSNDDITTINRKAESKKQVYEKMKFTRGKGKKTKTS